MEPKRELLLVEDELAHADLVMRALRTAQVPYVLRHVRTLSEAQSYLGQSRPSIIFADYRLPDGTCMDLVQRVGAEIPVVVLTGQGDGSLALELMRAGATDYWVKSPEVLGSAPEILERSLRAWGICQERKAAQMAELERAKSDAKSASRSKSAFLANMSHEVRTPMNAILGMTLLASHSTTDPKLREYLQKVEDSAKGLLKLLNGILDYSRMEAGELELENIHFDLDDLLSDAGTAVKAEASRKGIELLYVVDANVPRRLVGDPLRIGQILFNLVGNAVKFSEQGEVHIVVTQTAEMESRIQLHVAVQDTGSGIAPEKMEQIFEPFEQGEYTISRRHGGVGLGLSISRHLVQLMKGSIWAESTVGQGSTFHFQLWLSRDQRPEVTPDLSGIQNMRVLVVDDSESSRDVMDSMLRTLKIKPTMAESGYEALQKLSAAAHREEPHDLVLLDWKMPHFDGVETARQIQKEFQEHELPAMVMMTAGSREELEAHIKGLSLKGVLMKPFTFSQLLDVILDVRGQSSMDSFESQGPQEEREGLKDARILLVDDNAVSRKVARRILEQAGANVVWACNGQEAVDCVVQKEYDLVVMDCQMPVMDGFEATRRIRREPRFTQLPIIAMTASVLMEDRARCILSGMNEHVGKPIDAKLLLDAVSRWLRYSAQLRSSFVTLPDPAKGGAWCVDSEGPEKALLGAGFDLATALGRLTGDWGVYRNMLASFVRNQSQAPEEIRKALDQGDHAKAIRISHSLKGVAAFLGIVPLQSLAKTIEDHIGVVSREEVGALVGELRMVLDRSLDAVNAYQKLLQPVATPASGDPVDMEQFKALLDSSDSAAVDLANAFAKQYADHSERGKWAQKVCDCALRYDFTGALQALQQWKEA